MNHPGVFGMRRDLSLDHFWIEDEGNLFEEAKKVWDDLEYVRVWVFSDDPGRAPWTAGRENDCERPPS